MLCVKSNVACLCPQICEKTESEKMKCLTPKLPLSEDDLKNPKFVSYGLRLDGVKAVRNLTSISSDHFRPFKIYPDPKFTKFENGVKIHLQKNELLFIEVSIQ